LKCFGLDNELMIWNLRTSKYNNEFVIFVDVFEEF